MATNVYRGSGNLFADLGVEAEETANLQLRSTLMIQLTKRPTTRGATQAQAAGLVGVSQPRVSALLRGRIDRFRVDALTRRPGKTGAEVRVSVRNRSRAT